MPQSHRFVKILSTNGFSPLAGRPGQPGEQPAEVLAFLQRYLAAVDFGDVADDGEPQARARLAGGVEPRAARE